MTGTERAVGKILCSFFHIHNLYHNSMQKQISAAVIFQIIANDFVNYFLHEISYNCLFLLQKGNFYPNMTTLHSGTSYRKSISLSCVTFVYPTQLVEIFGNVSMPFCTLGIC